MTVDHYDAAEPPTPDPVPALDPVSVSVSVSVSDRALTRYTARIRRARVLYFSAVAAIVIAVSITVAVVWSHGEVAHSTLHTVPSAPLSVALQAPSTSLSQRWHSQDGTALGTPDWGGTVITHSADSVRGRDARSGKITWSYTRTDRTVCQAIQVQGVTLAIFELNGNCDEITALDSATGARMWTRTVDMDGHPLNGHPTYSIGQYTVLLTTPSVIYAIDPASGIDRWEFDQDGCRIHAAVLGSQGALISQTCAHPDCGELKFCGAGPQLLLRDGSAGRDDDSKDNPDQIKWNLIGNSDVPVSADQVSSALDTATDTLNVLDVAKGKTLHSHPLRPAPPSVQDIRSVEAADGELIWMGGVTYCLDSTGSRLSWAEPTAAPPTIASTGPDQLPDLDAARLTVPTREGIAQLDGVDGRTERSFGVAAPPAGSAVYPFGTGFIVAGPSTTVYR